LANKLGNLVSRVSALAEKHGLEKTKNSLVKKLDLKKVEIYFERYELDKVLGEIFSFIDICNEYVQKTQPWVSGDKKVLYELADSIKAIAILLFPFMPESSEKVSKIFNFEINYENIVEPLKVSKIKKAPVLFQKIELNDKVNKSEKVEGVMAIGEIKYDDFAKLDLRVGTIVGVEEVEGADKLLKLNVDMGKEFGTRTICAGIKKYYAKEKLKGKQIVVVANLEPRTMRGVESKGMLLAAGSPNENVCVLISPDSKVENGTRIN
jgi:methionyl-tRNA synthetase